MAAGPPEQIPAIENTIDFLASSVPRRTVLGAHARFEIAESSFHALTSPQQKALEDAAETGERKVDYGKDIVVVKLDAKVDAKHNRWKRKDPNTKWDCSFFNQRIRYHRCHSIRAQQQSLEAGPARVGGARRRHTPEILLVLCFS